MTRLRAAAAALCALVAAQAGAATGGLKNVEEFTLHSDSVGINYQILVALPPQYSSPDSAFPVIYNLDSDITFGMMTDISRMLRLDAEIPATILVGIAYNQPEEEWRRNRNRDLTPAAVEWNKDGGGAHAFLAFIHHELVPAIEKRYRTKPGDRTISGASYAGLFALYALLADPDLFQRYLAAVPTVGYGERHLYRMEEALAAERHDLPARVFISAEGSVDDVDYVRYWSEIWDFTARLRGRQYPGLHLRTVIYDGETHAQAQPRSFTAGLKYLFSAAP
ncbi:MAG: alpha/beta hydrolase-fold protein [Candidatus Latescibacterota bacterium]